jgi:hypothetical protein
MIGADDLRAARERGLELAGVALLGLDEARVGAGGHQEAGVDAGLDLRRLAVSRRDPESLSA